MKKKEKHNLHSYPKKSNRNNETNSQKFCNYFPPLFFFEKKILEFGSSRDYSKIKYFHYGLYVHILTDYDRLHKD